MFVAQYKSMGLMKTVAVLAMTGLVVVVVVVVVVVEF
jgi:hypothetical protein